LNDAGVAGTCRIVIPPKGLIMLAYVETPAAPAKRAFCMGDWKRGLASVIVAALALPAFSQQIPGVQPDTEAMYQHMKRAREIAGADLYPYYTHRCIMDQTYRRTISHSLQAPNRIEPARVFDQLYFVGQNAVSAWALTTSEGIVLFDTLNSPEEVKSIIEPGLRKFGLDPKNIRYVVITHAHGDHYAGAQYLHDTYGSRLLASDIDWAEMARQSRGEGNLPASWAKLVPQRDMSIADGQTMKIGDTELHFYVTPGHTPGTVSTVFSVTDNGRKHVVGFFGGMGTPSSAEDKHKLMASATRFETIAGRAGVDTLIANHPTQDQLIPKIEELRLRHAGDPNPFVIGPDRFRRFLEIQRECTIVAMAQQGQK
jgi:metallo-beta-lactamase class B